MRIWLSPDQLARFNLTIPEVINALQQQNAVNPIGVLGGEPVPRGQEFTLMAVARGPLITPEQFGNVVVRELSDGAVVRIRDLGRVELGSQVYTTKARLNGEPSALLPSINYLGATR